MIWMAYVTAGLLLVLALILLGLYSTYRRFSRDLPKPPYKTPRVRPELNQFTSTETTVTWIGHSTVYANIQGVRILTDPVFSEKVGVSVFGNLRIGRRRHTAPAVSLNEVPPVDVIFLSHAHLDHLDLPTLRKLTHPTTEVVTAVGTSGLLRGLPFRAVHELGGIDELTLSTGMKVQALPVRHWGRRYPWNKDYQWTGYLIEHRDVSVVFAGDTAYTSTFAELLHNRSVDLVMMPIGAYSPDSFQTSHCTPEQAWGMFQDTGASWLLPIHHDTFVLSREPVHEPLQRLLAAAGPAMHRVVVREHGASFQLPK